MITDIKEKLKDAYDDAVEYFNGEDKTIEILEKAVWAEYHAQVSEFATLFARDGGSDTDKEIGQQVLALAVLRKKRDDQLETVGKIEEGLEKVEDAAEEAEDK